MANYYASARSNYFRVKDREAFDAWADKRGIGIWDHAAEKDGRIGIHPRNADDGGWPSMAYDEEADDYEEFDLFTELSEHLVDGEVAILLEVGAEKLRYLCGFARVINAAGEVAFLSLEELAMEKAKTMGTSVTECVY